jgi:DNA repair photolyase
MKETTDKPAHGTGEWATETWNLQSGCRNQCAYCYAEGMAVRFKRKTPESWGTPDIYLNKVCQRFGKKKGRIMFPSTHDIDELNIDACVTALKKMLAAGNAVLIVSKPRLACIRRLCDELAAHKPQITFRFTIGSADDVVLMAWEPGAPSFAERLAGLKLAFDAGFQTSVSCEPMLDAQVDKVIEAARPYVNDAIWLGKANQLRQAVAINRPGDTKVKALADELIAVMTDEFVKRLYALYRNDTVIKFKDSIKKVVGLERPTVKGLDV